MHEKKTTNPIHLYCGNVHVYQTGNLSSHKDVHTHASSSLVLRNPVTVTFDLFDLRVNACRDPAMQYYVYAKFAVDSSSRLSFTARTQRQKETQSQMTQITIQTLHRAAPTQLAYTFRPDV